MKIIKKIALCIMCMAMVLVAGNVAKAEAVPRLIVTGYKSTPEEIKAGDTFTLTLHMENMSDKTSLYNIKITLSTPDSELVPVSGSNTLYIEKISIGETIDVNVEMQAKTNLDSKTYILTMTSDYEDKYNSLYSDTANLSIPVVQEARLSVTEKEFPESAISLGEEANIMFSINNQGRTEIYNVNVFVEGDNISEGTDFVGNIPSGGTGYVDLYVEGKKVTGDEEGSATIKITYEDAEGNLGEMTFENPIIVEEAQIDEMDEYVENEVVRRENVFSLPIPFIIVGVVAIIIIVFAVNHKKSKKEEDEDEI